MHALNLGVGKVRINGFGRVGRTRSVHLSRFLQRERTYLAIENVSNSGFPLLKLHQSHVRLEDLNICPRLQYY